MTRAEALERLARKGIVGADAETGLDRVVGFEVRLQGLLEGARDLSPSAVMTVFGSDNGRVILALREESS